MSTVHEAQDIATVMHALHGAAIFPSRVYGTNPPYEVFAFGPNGVNEFPETSRYEGKAAFSGWDDVKKYPLIGWFFDDQPDWEIENATVVKTTVTVQTIVAYQNKDLDVALNRCHRALNLCREFIGKQTSLQGLTYGPFARTSAAVVPASFGTLLHIYPRCGKNVVNEEPKLGPDRAVGAMATEYTLWVT